MRLFRFIAPALTVTCWAGSNDAPACIVRSIDVIKISVVNAPIGSESIFEARRPICVQSAFASQQAVTLRVSQRPGRVYYHRLLHARWQYASGLIIRRAHPLVKRVGGKPRPKAAAQIVRWCLPAIFQLEPYGRTIVGAHIVNTSPADEHIGPKFTFLGIAGDPRLPRSCEKGQHRYTNCRLLQPRVAVTLLRTGMFDLAC